MTDPVKRADFPLHSTGRMIPWSVAERAYEVYSKRYGTSQSLERLAQRGGFGAEELDDMIPGWREEVEEIYLLRAEVKALREKRENTRRVAAATFDTLTESIEHRKSLEAELTSLRGVVEKQRTALEKIADDETDYPRQVAQEALLPKVT